jgi:hypothetical protein
MASAWPGRQMWNIPSHFVRHGPPDRCPAPDPIRNAFAVDHDRPTVAQHLKSASLAVCVTLAGQVNDVKQRAFVCTPIVYPPGGDRIAVPDHSVGHQVIPDRGAKPTHERFRRRSHLGEGEKKDDRHEPN